MSTYPGLMDEWRDTFITQARLHYVSGPRIGQALAEIDTHCADSGQSPTEAFGDPVDYARALAVDLPPDAFGDMRRLPGFSALLAVATIGGVLFLLEGVDAVAHATRAVVTAGELASIVAGVIMITIIDAVILRPGRRKIPAPMAIAVAVGIGLIFLPQVIWKQTVVEVGGWVLLTVGVLLLAFTWWPKALRLFRNDQIVDPRTGDEPFPVPRVISMVNRWCLPAFLLVAVLLIVLLPTK